MALMACSSDFIELQAFANELSLLVMHIVTVLDVIYVN